MNQKDLQVSTPGGTCLSDKVGVMPNENTNNMDIVLHHRDGGLHSTSELHKGYDSCSTYFCHGTKAS